MTSGRFGKPLHIPQDAREQLGLGYVLNVGPVFGAPMDETGRDAGFFDLLEDPYDIIGRKVIFGLWTGQDIHLRLEGEESRQFPTKFLVFNEWELWGYVDSTDKDRRIDDE